MLKFISRNSWFDIPFFLSNILFNNFVYHNKTKQKWPVFLETIGQYNMYSFFRTLAFDFFHFALYCYVGRIDDNRLIEEKVNIVFVCGLRHECISFLYIRPLIIVYVLQKTSSILFISFFKWRYFLNPSGPNFFLRRSRLTSIFFVEIIVWDFFKILEKHFDFRSTVVVSIQCRDKKNVYNFWRYFDFNNLSQVRCL